MPELPVSSEILQVQGKKIAVLPAVGIGDALLMMIASHQLKKAGADVTTFHASLPELSPWFPGQTLQPLPSEEELVDLLVPYDLILIENDNAPRVRHLHCLFPERVLIFYPSYRASKHLPLSSHDRAFDGTLPMAENVARSIASLLGLPSPSKDNGLTPPPHLHFRAKKEQILLHPTSRVPAKNWKAEGFIEVAEKLKQRGLHPLFCVGPSERSAWKHIEKKGLELADLPDLCALAERVYESGYVIGNDSLTGHLASNLGVPALIIANDEKRMDLWQPGWLPAKLVLPPPYLPNWRWLRLREKHWQRFIPVRRVLRGFEKLFCAL